jgi:hypothetical protein
MKLKELLPPPKEEEKTEAKQIRYSKYAPKCPHCRDLYTYELVKFPGIFICRKSNKTVKLEKKS